MKQRGKQSSVAEITPKIEIVSRETAPAVLTGDQISIWNDTLGRMPAEWFKDSVGTLIQYCRHRVRANRLAQLVEEYESDEDFDLKVYQALLLSERQNTTVIESCETKLRLTPQTRFDKSKKTGPQGKAPWQ